MGYEILINVSGQTRNLEVNSNEPISLIYNIANIADISARNSSFSKTITVPETAVNRQIFGDIANLSVDSNFNSNKKTKCWVLSDSVVIFEGYLQLKKANVDLSNNITNYECVIYADNDNLYKELGESELTDLDFSELNHFWSSANVVQSWTASWEGGYFYPLIDYGSDFNYNDINGSFNALTQGKLKSTQLFPSTNVKYILNKIFNAAGYSYNSEFLESDVFKALYIPFNRDGLVRTTEGTNDKLYIGINTAQEFVTNKLLVIASPTYSNSGTGRVLPNETLQTIWTGRIPFNVETTPYGDPNGLWSSTKWEYTAPQEFIGQNFICRFDITMPYHTTSTDWRRSFGNNYFTSICFKRSKNPDTGLDVAGGVIVPVNGSTNPVIFSTEQIPDLQFNSDFSRATGTIMADALDGVSARKLYPGEKLWVEVKVGVSNIKAVSGGLAVYGVPPNYSVNRWYIPQNKVVVRFNPSCGIWNSLSTVVRLDETIQYNNVIPLKVKQKDFLNSLVKMFNLIIEPSKEFDRVLNIEPRDDYYASGSIKDWSRKLDISEAIEIDILSDTQNKKVTFKYKDDSDYYNVDYKTKRGGLAYGADEIVFDNDFISNEKTIELTFSPTPLVKMPGSNAIIIPKIGKIDNSLFSKTSHNIRILTKYLSSTDSTWVYGDFSPVTTGQFNGLTYLTSNGYGNAIVPFKVGDHIRVNQTDGGAVNPLLQRTTKVLEITNTKTIVVDVNYWEDGGLMGGICTPIDGLVPLSQSDKILYGSTYIYGYPYLGHFNNPNSPNFDLNFGQTSGLYYPQKVVTANNLYSVYWENLIAELNDPSSRKVVAKFNLNANDIADFKFSDNIYVGDQYYKVNKITYDPSIGGLSEVELIKTQFITIPRAFEKWSTKYEDISTIGEAYTKTNKKSAATSGLYGGQNEADLNETTTSKSLVLGDTNKVYTKSSLVVGNGNGVSSGKAIVMGDDNTISSGVERSMVFGRNNTVLTGVDNAIVFGSDLTIGDSNTTTFGTAIIVASNELSACRNEIISSLPGNKNVNYVSASMNAVLEPGSVDIINVINGGRFTEL